MIYSYATVGVNLSRGCLNHAGTDLYITVEGAVISWKNKGSRGIKSTGFSAGLFLFAH